MTDLKVSYVVWKDVMVANPAFTAYYTLVSDGYHVIAGNGFATYTALTESSVDVVDFATNYLSAAIQVVSLDDAKVSIVTVVDTPPILISGRDSSGASSDLPVGRAGTPAGGTGFPIIGNDNGVSRELSIRNNGTARTEAIPYLWNTLEGNVPGHTAFYREIAMPVNRRTSSIFVLGLWNEQTVPTQWSLVSSSAQDANGNTGAQKIIIEFINGLGVRTTEVVILSGTTAVDINSKNALYIDSFKVINVGTAKSNVGIISIMSSINGGGVPVAQILAGNNRMYSSVFYSSVNETTFIAEVSVGTSDKNITFTSKHYRDFSSIGGGQNVADSSYFDISGKGAVSYPLSIPRKIMPNEKIEVYASAVRPGNIGYYRVSGWRE